MADNWQLKAVLSAVDKMSPVLKQVGTAAKSTRKYLSDIASSANHLTGKVGLPLTAISGALTGFSAYAIKNAVVGFTEMGEAVYKSSLRTGMSVEQLQRMKYVSEQAGVPVENLELGMAKLNKQIGDASVGKNKDFAGLLQKLGISARDSNGQLKTGIDILPQLADAFVRNKNPVVQARMGMAAFGKSWQEMVPLLMEGSDGIASSLQRFDKFKGVLSLDDIKGAKELGDKFKDLEFVTKGFQNTIAKELVPVLGPVIEDIIQWGAANRKLISSNVKEFVQNLVAAMKQIDWRGLAAGFQSIASAIGKFVDMVGGAQNALIILAVVMNAQTIMATAALAGSVLRAGWALGSLALSALAPVAPLQTLSTAMMATNAKAATLLGTVGKLGAAAGIAGSAFAGWEVGGWLNENVINPTVQNLSGKKNASLGTWIYDKLHPEQAAAEDALTRPSLVRARSVNASGTIQVSFKDAPPGMRVEQSGGGDVPINTDVGYRSYALGMP